MSSSHSSAMNSAVLASKNPVSWICIFFASGYRPSSSMPTAYSSTTSSSKPSSSVMRRAIQGFITESSTLCMSTLVSKWRGNLSLRSSDASLSVNRLS